MSVAELIPSGGEFDRTPPHDVAAEQCVLGGMLMSKDAISDVMEVIRSGDHYRPAHQLIHEAILDLYGRGEPADPVTVRDLLTKRGELARAGGAPYLHTLIAAVPTAANAGYYARIVRERAILRRLVEVGTRIVQLGYAGDGDADELVDRAQAEVYAVTERRITEDFLPLSEIMPGTLDEIEAIGSHGGRMTGVPTGFADLDALTNGLHAGQMVVIAARPAIGKALALDTPLPTPTGWTTMGEAAAGDELLGPDGRPARVVAATAVMEGRPCYEVEFCDGEVIVADAGHRWVTWPAPVQAPATWPGPGELRGGHPGHPDVLTTAEILASIRDGQHPHHAIPVTRPVQCRDALLPVAPYAFGVWLGAGEDESGLGGGADPETVMRADAAAGHGLGTVSRIRRGDLPQATHIPPAYLRASVSQRRDLLAGLLDTLGTVRPTGEIEVATRGALTDGLAELLVSLGYRCTLARGAAGRSGLSAPCDLITFATADEVFRSSGKQVEHKERMHADPELPRWRQIVDVRPVPSVPVRCLQVDRADGLFLAGRSMIPTHNSTLALDLARAAAIKHALPTVIFSLEMSRNEITMRLLSAEARVALQSMRTGRLNEDDWMRLARRMSEVADSPLFIDDSPNLSMMEIRAKCRRLKQRHGLRLVILDYLQLMSSPRRVENRQQEVSEMSRSLKLLAKELDVPVIAISQLNRGPEQRNDKRPLLSDLRESGSIEQDSDMVILLHREDAYEPESPRAGEADLIVAKHRNGPTTTVTVAFQGHYSRFVDMAGN